MTVGLVNYGAGNYKSVANALEYLEIEFVPVQVPGEVDLADRIILPGVGSFHHAMETLQARGLIDPLLRAVMEDGRYYLGICVGMQILATMGTEFVDTPGLDAIPGSVVKIEVDDPKLPIPQMGWNEVSQVGTSPLFAGIEDQASFYFVHSFHLVPETEGHLSGTCQYGGLVTASVEHDNVFGVQFHPEKSQLNGLQLLRNFVSLGE